MSATGHKGLSVLETDNRIVFRCLLQGGAGTILTSGTANLYLYELQSDGTLKSYDWSDNTFKTTALGTETQALTQRTGNNSTTNTGLWTFALTTLTGFTKGAIYFARVDHSSAVPIEQVREFQFGSAEGDLVVDSNGFLEVDVEDWKGATAPAMTGDAYARIGAAGAGLTALGDTRIANLDAAVSSRMATFSLPTNFSSLSISAAGKINEVVLVDTLTTYTGNTPQTGDSYARLGAPAGASISADIAEIESETDDIAAIKTKTDSLTFTVTNQVDSNIQYVNDVLVNGDGSGTPWGP